MSIAVPYKYLIGGCRLRIAQCSPAVSPCEMQIRKLVCFLLLGVFLSLATQVAVASGPTAQEKLVQTKWSDIHGINFVPTYAENTYEIWRNYDHAEVDRELRLAESVGLNSVRLWLNYAAFQEMGPEMLDHVEDALRLSAKYHLRAVMVLFDSCGVRPRKDAKLMSRREAYDLFQRSPRFSADQKLLMQRLFGNFIQGIGGPTQVPVGSDSPMTVLLWGNWQPTPGNDRLGPEWYPKLEAYVDAVVGRFKDNPTIMLWDLMNEPEFASEGPLSTTEVITPEMQKTLDAFLQHFHDYMKQHYRNELVCEGWANVANAEKYADSADVLTFHVYGGPEKVKAAIDKAQVFSEHLAKKVVITETLSDFDFGSPNFGKHAPPGHTQLAHYQKVLPVLMNSGMGWMSFGLVSKQKNPLSESDLALFSSDGIPRPAALYLRKRLRAASAVKSLRDPH